MSAFPWGSGRKRPASNPATNRGDRRLALSKVVPLDQTRAVGPGHATDTDYALFSPILQGSDPIELGLTLRSPAGEICHSGVTGEQHIEQAARSRGLSPAFLKVVDLFHVLTYPFLLFAAWVLHRRKREDLISSILSLAVLLTVGAEQPSATFLVTSRTCLVAPAHLRSWQYLPSRRHFPVPVRPASPRVVVPFLCLLPLLFFLHGNIYRVTFVIFMIAGVMTMLVRLRRTPPSAARQQIKWALFGFSGYSLFLPSPSPAT